MDNSFLLKTGEFLKYKKYFKVPNIYGGISLHPYVYEQGLKMGVWKDMVDPHLLSVIFTVVNS